MRIHTKDFNMVKYTFWSPKLGKPRIPKKQKRLQWQEDLKLVK
jgi:hypothetical protein